MLIGIFDTGCEMSDDTPEKILLYTGLLQGWVSTMLQGIRVEHSPSGYPYEWNVFQRREHLGTLSLPIYFADMNGNKARDFLYSYTKQFLMVRGIDYIFFGPTFYFLVQATDRAEYVAQVKAFNLKSAAACVKKQPGTVSFQLVEQDDISPAMLSNLEEL